MKVKIVYRNYKPLHKIYESLVQFPPAGVEYIVPPTLSRFTKLYGVYKKLKFLPFVKHFVHLFERTFFLRKEDGEPVDLYHYINIIDEHPPQTPYVVDIEHAASLVSFTPDEQRIKKVVAFLQNPYCKSIDCLSDAAKRSLKKLLGTKYASIADKVHVVYPALQEIDHSFSADFSYISNTTSSLKLLFVGNQAYLKGLEEVLEAVKRINQKFSPAKLELHVISGDGKPEVEKYNLKNVSLYAPSFSKKDILCKFFIPADVFVMPTKEDTFGMAILDSLACSTPVISTKQFAVPELVSDGVDGLLVKIDKPLLDTVSVPDKDDMASVTEPNMDISMVEQLVDMLSKILENKVDLKKFGKHGQAKVKYGGKFAVNTRNKELLRIYEAALRS